MQVAVSCVICQADEGLAEHGQQDNYETRNAPKPPSFRTTWRNRFGDVAWPRVNRCFGNNGSVCWMQHFRDVSQVERASEFQSFSSALFLLCRLWILSRYRSIRRNSGSVSNPERMREN